MSMTYPKRERKEGNFKKTKAKVNPKPSDQRNTYVTEPTVIKQNNLLASQFRIRNRF